MATVDKDIADRVVAGEFDDDGWIKIIEYTTPEGAKAYGLLHQNDDPCRYWPSPCVINPTTYWEKP